MHKLKMLLPLLAATCATQGRAQATDSVAQPVFSVARPAADRALAGQRGGTDVKSRADFTGTVSNTSATNVVAGGNVIRDGSFANVVGLPTVVQNSGSNVLIQSSVTVNVQFKQP